MDDDLAVGESAGRPILDPFDPVDPSDLDRSIGTA
jgi:hypothetical protein